MNNGLIEQSRETVQNENVAITLNPSAPQADRTQNLEQLYLASCADLRSLIFEAEPSLFVTDADTILESLAGSLPEYCGELTLEAFYQWASAFVLTAAKRSAVTLEIITKYRHLIETAVFKYSRASALDLAVETDALIFKYADSLARRGTAKLSTRLTAMVRRHCWQQLKKRIRRFEIVTQYPDQSHFSIPEIFSKDELASIALDAQEIENNPFYS
jgi:hypothetical protein